MTDEQKLKAFAQSVILAMTAKHMDQEDLDGEEGTQWIKELIDWTNQYVSGELELADDWNDVRENNAVIGTVAAPADTFTLPEGARKLAVNEHRPLKILQDGSPISIWDVVKPSMITASRDEWPIRERVSYVRRQVIFSRSLNENEIGGQVVADILHHFPVLANDNTELLDYDLRSLIVLGVAKNATLPDFVRGGISPSLGQKYADMLETAMEENWATAASDYYEGDNFSQIRGVY